jgi:hypothetical protein
MLEAYTRAQLPIEALGERTAWRDRSIVALRGLREANPPLPVRPSNSLACDQRLAASRIR